MEAAQSVDDYMFEQAVNQCQSVSEATSCLEIFRYSDPQFNSIEEHPLAMDELDKFLQPVAMDQLDNFLHRRGAFTPPSLTGNVQLVTGLRLVLQKDAADKDTFAPQTISMTHDAYSSMVHALHLPRMAIETSSVVGLFFWCEVEHDEDGRAYLQMIFRKSDVIKKGKTRGWELILSHDFSTGITNGFFKGTPTSHIKDSINQLKACSSDIEHAMFLPLIIFSHLSSPLSEMRPEMRQRDARAWLRILEEAISTRSISQETSEGEDGDTKYGIDLNRMHKDLVECQAMALWHRPTAYISVIGHMEEAARLFMNTVSEGRKSSRMQHFQERMISRLHLYREKWNGIDTYVNTTFVRLDTQRGALQTVIAQKESKLNLQIATEQRKLAYLSKRDSEAMKGISLLGAVFLPGTFLASVFSTTFFDFKDAHDMASVVSTNFWVYWAATIPFTLIVVAIFFLWERNRKVSYKRDEAQLERDIEKLETDITKGIIKRAANKVRAR